jgi:hypothetical protein
VYSFSSVDERNLESNLKTLNLVHKIGKAVFIILGIIFLILGIYNLIMMFTEEDEAERERERESRKIINWFANYNLKKLL